MQLHPVPIPACEAEAVGFLNRATFRQLRELMARSARTLPLIEE
jgi:hypothetical protein